MTDDFFKFISFVRKRTCLTVGLGDSLQLVLLLDGVRVRRTLEEQEMRIQFLNYFTTQELVLMICSGTLAALISSSARHSAMVLMFLKAASLAPVHNSQMACRTTAR